jgi:hypothetical protein
MKRSVTLGAGLLASALLLLGTGGVHAQVPATAKCSAAKMKCATNKATGLLKCHQKAEAKGIAVDPACVMKVESKFTLPVKGCMEKAESKGAKQPCATTGDAPTIEAKIDAFVDDAVVEVDPMFPTPVKDKCSAGKKKCVGNKVKALLKCYAKNTTKPDPVKFDACVQKAHDKFDGGAKPEKGCFTKLEAKYPMASATPCQTFGDTPALEAKVDAFVDDVFEELVPPSSLKFATATPGGNCGTVEDGVPSLIKNLTCGGLNIGAGGSIVPEGAVPDGSVSQFTLSCAGSSCTIGPTTTAPPPNSAAPDCTDTGCNFGTPLPIPNPTIPTITTCVLNTWSAPASGSLDLSTGTSSTSVPLNSDIYLTGNLGQPCPRCSATGTPTSPGTGTCDRGPQAGMACTTTSSTGATRDCPTGGTDGGHPCTPGGGACIDGSHVGVIAVNLTPLTTGSASATDPGGIFCPGDGQVHPGCFGAASCVTITENGTPAGPVTRGVPTGATLASVFCIAATGNGLVDASADLPGPGAVALPGTFEVN